MRPRPSPATIRLTPARAPERAPATSPRMNARPAQARRAPPLATAALALGACTHAAEAPPGPTVAYEIVAGRSEPGPPNPERVVIFVEPGVSMRSTTTTTTRDGETTTRTETTVDGRELVLAGDELRLNGERYGPLKPGSVVVVGKDGVSVDGKAMSPRR